jgi:hypothetical protein
VQGRRLPCEVKPAGASEAPRMHLGRQPAGVDGHDWSGLTSDGKSVAKPANTWSKPSVAAGEPCVGGVLAGGVTVSSRAGTGAAVVPPASVRTIG